MCTYLEKATFFRQTLIQFIDFDRKNVQQGHQQLIFEHLYFTALNCVHPPTASFIWREAVPTSKNFSSLPIGKAT